MSLTTSPFVDIKYNYWISVTTPLSHDDNIYRFTRDNLLGEGWDGGMYGGVAGFSSLISSIKVYLPLGIQPTYPLTTNYLHQFNQPSSNLSGHLVLSYDMDISNPRRILAVSLTDSTQHLTRVIKGSYYLRFYTS